MSRRIRLAAAVLVFSVAAAARAGSPAYVVQRSQTDQTAAYGSVYHAVAVAPATGEVIVGGFQVDRSLPTQTWVLLRKYDRNGTLVWTVSLAGSGGPSTGAEQSIRALAIVPGSGTSFDVIIAGSLWGGAVSGGDAWLARVDENGTFKWSLTVDGAASGDDSIRGVVLTPAGQLAVTGEEHNAAGYSTLWLAIYDLAGNPQSSTFLPNGIGKNQVGRAVAVDASGSLYVTGSVINASTDLYVAKLDASNPNLASPLWSLTLDDPVSGTDYGNGIALLPGGDVVVAGALQGATSKQDLFVARIANNGPAAGTTVWTVQRDGSTDDDNANGVITDAAGTIYVIGNLNPASLNWSDFWVGAYGSDGSPQWELDQDGTGHYLDNGWGLAQDGAGNLYAAGVLWQNLSASSTEGRCAALLKLVPPPTGSAATTAGQVPVGPHAAPNPFRPGSGGAYDASAVTFTTLPPGSTVRVWRMDGQLVAELVDTAQAGFIVWNAKAQNGKNVASGVYVFTVTPPTGPVFRGKVVIAR